MINLSGELLHVPGLTGTYGIYEYVIIMIIALIVLIFWGPLTLTRNRQRNSDRFTLPACL